MAPGNPYGYAYNYPLVNDGYYYPGIGIPYVILPGEAETTPEIQKRQIDREHRLERAYRQRAGASGDGNPVTGIGNVAAGPSQNSGIANGAAQNKRMNVNPSATSGGTSSGQGSTTPRTFPQPGQPGGAPAAHMLLRRPLVVHPGAAKRIRQPAHPVEHRPAEPRNRSSNQSSY